jgi:hypothetical protein
MLGKELPVQKLVLKFVVEVANLGDKKEQVALVLDRFVHHYGVEAVSSLVPSRETMRSR